MKSRLKKANEQRSYKQSLILKKELNCSLSLVQKVVYPLQKLNLLKPKEQSLQDLGLAFYEQKQRHFMLYQPLVFC